MRSASLKKFSFHRVIVLALLSNLVHAHSHAEACVDAEPSDLQERWKSQDLAGIEFIESSRCTIPKFSHLSLQEFNQNFLNRHPVIFTAPPSRNQLARRLTEKSSLLELYGDKEIVLSSANAHSYEKRKSTLSEYVSNHMGPWSLTQMANTTFYHFGNNDYAAWKEVFDSYQIPTFVQYRDSVSFSFGLAGSGSGVPFHIHGPVFAEVLHGKKRWFLSAPDQKPNFHPDETTLKWLGARSMPFDDNTPTKNMHGQQVNQANEEYILECTCGPNDIIYLPPSWWHATLNIGETVFISSFV